jgi:hypothetical protein
MSTICFLTFSIPVKMSLGEANFDCRELGVKYGYLLNINIISLAEASILILDWYLFIGSFWRASLVLYLISFAQ